MNLCAIDFETANGYRSSACSIGIVKVRDGRIVDEFLSLINQSDTEFWHSFIDIHGIDAAMTVGAPSFKDLWLRIKAFIGDDELSAHNAVFDRSVLVAMLEANGIEWQVPEFHCSLMTTRKCWPGLNRHSLDVVAAHLGLELDHHEALSDARACAEIMIAAGNSYLPTTDNTNPKRNP